MYSSQKMQVIFLLFITVAVFVGVGTSAEERVTVATVYGKVRGFRVPLTDGADPTRPSANVFLGIPFAKPPVGSLRFEKPQTPDVWLNVRDADQFAAPCFPLSRAIIQYYNALTVSEDCLYLNIMTPNWKNEAEPNGFPVMVFVHGGGFQSGSAIEFGYSNFVNKYLARDVIIVTVQYRVAQIGFLAINGTDLIGNYGMWDLIAALKFVRDNIARFGGDRDRVTVFGHSAGGAAVGHVAMSPHSEGLFANAIQMSGSPYADWATSPRTEAGGALAAALGCAEAKSVKSCLQQKTTDELIDVIDTIGSYRRNSSNFIIFAPRIDGDFLPNSLADAPRKVKEKRPLLIGSVDCETLIFTVAGACGGNCDVFVKPEDQAHFDEESFIGAMKTLMANENRVGSEGAAAELLERLVDFYLRRADEHTPPVIYNGATKNDSSFYLRQYTKVLSDAMFLVPALIDAQEKAAAGWPVYLYRFGYINMDTVPEPLKPFFTANTHAGEYPYLFNISYGTPIPSYNEEDLKFQENFLSTIVQFAKTGNPTTTTVEWPRLVGSAVDSLSHVELAPALIARDHLPFQTKTLAFWRGLGADFNFPEVWQFPKGESMRDEL